MIAMPSRVLFVCRGNICRSPLAEGVFRQLVSERGLAEFYEVDSAGTAGMHAGELPDDRTERVLRAHGAYYPHLARQIRIADFAYYDLIFSADERNIDLMRPFCHTDHRHKLRLMLEPLGGGDIDDPFYLPEPYFERIYQQLYRSFTAFLTNPVLK